MKKQDKTIALVQPIVKDAPGLPLFEIGADFGLLTMDQVATLLGKKPGTVKNWVARREIPFVLVGNRTMFLRDSVRAWLQQKEVKPHGSY